MKLAIAKIANRSEREKAHVNVHRLVSASRPVGLDGMVEMLSRFLSVLVKLIRPVHELIHKVRKHCFG